jgi:hypothetical protein
MSNYDGHEEVQGDISLVSDINKLVIMLSKEKYQMPDVVLLLQIILRKVFECRDIPLIIAY